MKKIHTLLAIGILATFLCGCNFSHYIYRADVAQGNLVTEEMISQLKIGMTRPQVHFVLGEPLVRSDLHLNRWDYIYYYYPWHGEVQNRHVTVFFDKNDRLEKIVKDDLPTERQADEMVLGIKTDFQTKKD